MSKQTISGKRLFILDTNVLMHDPTAIYRFQEHDIFISMMVLEELDKAKKGMSEVSRNVRQVSRFFDNLIQNVDKPAIVAGLPLPNTEYTSQHAPAGRLFFQTESYPMILPAAMPGSADNEILNAALSLAQHSGYTVTLVSKDINLRIKAAILGIHVEDYYNDQVLDDVNLLYTGLHELAADFWQTHSKNMSSWKEEGRTFYKITGPETVNWHPGQCIYLDDANEFEAIVRSINPQEASANIELANNWRHPRHTVWGINARNREQNFALNLLLDPELDFVTLLGTAGTGKTLLALAAALTQTLEENRYKEIIMTRVTVPVGEDIGFLPGTEEEKMTPWMGALMDNLEVLSGAERSGPWGRAASNDLLLNRIKIHSLNFMRGRTFLNKFLIIDEAQNLTAKQMKTLITRAGPGTKVVCLGNVSQIDTPYLTETSSGLTYVVDRFQHWEHSAHITLLRGERSRLADHASEIL